MRDQGFESWSQGRVGIVGAGALGGPLAMGAARSGVGGVSIWDFDVGTIENQGNQLSQPGVPKVDTIVHACDEVRPGVAKGLTHDVRHAGIRDLMTCDVLLDCSDDAGLAWSLTETSNGLAIPLLRCAVDGSGQFELGRVLGSHGGKGIACQLCSYSLQDLRAGTMRMACPGGQVEPHPTRAGGAIASVISGFALLQAQRVVTGNDSEKALGREVVVDLSHHQLLDIQLQRSDRCLSGHLRWELIDLNKRASETTLREMFDDAQKECRATAAVTLSVYQHPLNMQASCGCGVVVQAVGTDWADPPSCRECRAPMRWLRETQIDRVDRATARDLGILETPLDRLGLPANGAMLLARIPDQPVRRFLLL